MRKLSVEEIERRVGYCREDIRHGRWHNENQHVQTAGAIVQAFREGDLPLEKAGDWLDEMAEGYAALRLFRKELDSQEQG